MTLSPSWSFQPIFTNYFEYINHIYLAIVDSFSSWLNIYHFHPTKVATQTLITTLRNLFVSYGIPGEISTGWKPPIQFFHICSISIQIGGGTISTIIGWIPSIKLMSWIRCQSCQANHHEKCITWWVPKQWKGNNSYYAILHHNITTP